MRVAVVGAAGFLGSAVVAALTEQGHTVRGLVRSAAQSERISRLGAAPVRGDLVSGRGLAELLEGCEAAVHLAQAAEGDLEDRRRVRVEGGRRLVAAAGTAGVRRIVIGSGYWVYRSSPEPIVEDSPIDPRSISLVNFETEQVAREAASRERFEVVYVRPGMVYGDGSWFGEMVRELRAGTYRHLGDGSNFMSPIHLADAASAFGAILERGAPGATYLAVDEAPVRVHDFASFVA